MIDSLVIKSKEDQGLPIIPEHELQIHGCKRCVWKLHGMCPHGEDCEFGYCVEYGAFLQNFAVPGDSLSAIWEKYELYVLRLQSLDDYKAFQEVQQKLARLEDEGSVDPKFLEELEVKRNTYKLWWFKLNESVLKSLGKVVDRESRQNVVKDSGPVKMSVQQLNQIINVSASKVLEYEGKVKDDRNS